VIRAGLIHNPRSRLNRAAGAPRAVPEGLLLESPRDRKALDGALAHFAQEGLELLIIDGGDGTVREVLTRAPAHFRSGLPTLAVLPSGKTNALAFDLGAPRHWPLQAALASAEAGRVAHRRPIEVIRAGAEAPLVRGFIFGAGAFVRGVDLAQRAHKLGAFEGLAVGLTLGAAGVQTLFGGPRSGWRSGERMRLRLDDAPSVEGDVFLLFASTLQRLPLGIQPFGPRNAETIGTLSIEAPPKRLSLALRPLLTGRDAPWLERAGYQRRNVERMDVDLERGFVLDGETYAGGELTVQAAPPLAFVIP